MLNVKDIIAQFYKPDTEAYRVLLIHGKMVSILAVEIAHQIDVNDINIRFIEEAAMLHDIGMIKTNTPDLGCFGKEPYIKHGILGKEMLNSIGLFKHALVCETHIGVGITKEDVIKRHLPLPAKDMVPISIEEKIVAFADKFYSKTPHKLTHKKSIDVVRKKIAKHGLQKLAIFDNWTQNFLQIEKA